MPPKAVVYHICGDHLAGEAVCGYAVGPDTPILMAPKLVLRGGAVIRNAPSLAAPKLLLYGKPGVMAGKPFGPTPIAAPRLVLRGVAATSGLPPGPRGIISPRLFLLPGLSSLSISSTFTVTPGGAHLFLLAGKAVGKEKAMVPTRPENILLPPTVEEDWLLIPTTERDM